MEGDDSWLLDGDGFAKSSDPAVAPGCIGYFSWAIDRTACSRVVLLPRRPHPWTTARAVELFVSYIIQYYTSSSCSTSSSPPPPLVHTRDSVPFLAQWSAALPKTHGRCTSALTNFLPILYSRRFTPRFRITLVPPLWARPVGFRAHLEIKNRRSQ